MKSAIFTLFAIALAVSACGERTTKGDIWDMEAADEAERCAGQYLGRPNSGPDAEIWIMCTQIASKRADRQVVRVANRVVKAQRRNVFEPGAAREISAAMIARLESGE